MPRVTAKMLLSAFFLTVTGIAGLLFCFLFESGIILPLWLSLSFVCLFGALGFWGSSVTPYALLPRAMFVIYSLPFIHSFEYLWIKDLHFRNMMWGLIANPYNTNMDIIPRMVMVGAVGLFGLVAGFLTVKLWGRAKEPPSAAQRSLKMVPFILVAVLSIALSWLNAPADTIFKAAYTTSDSILTSKNVNFNAAYVLSYVLAALLFIDALWDKTARKTVKVVIAVASLLLIVVWFQFLRGDRECLGLIFSLGAVYLSGMGKIPVKKMALYAVVFFCVFFTAQTVGLARGVSASDNGNNISLSEVSLSAGTWSAVLLTPLSVVGDFYNKAMFPKYGQTYVDYFLSIPPGMLAQMLGYERPIEGTRGPAWDMRYGIGGTHALVVPFMNFKSIGVFFVLFLYGVFGAVLERRFFETNSVKTKLLYASVFLILPFWFWYGEMSFVRAIMAFYLVWWLYLLMPKCAARPGSVKSGLAAGA